VVSGIGAAGARAVDRHPESILHVDMDAFYASVEQRDDPTLAGRPVAVGSPTGRGVVAAASYEARAFGIRSAMPMVRARRLCPDLVVVRPRFERYHEASERLMAVLRDVTPLVEPLSLDEAFLDVAGAVRLFGSPPEIGERIRSRVRSELHLPCSVGIGPTKSVAKLLSGLAKPDGLLHWPVEEVAGRLRPLPVSVLWGAGPRTTERLVANGLTTVGDVADVDVRLLRRLVGDALGSQLHTLAHGVDPRRVEPAQEARSISAETTFDEDVDDPVVLERRLQRLATGVARRLREQGLAARTVTVKVRFSDHRDISRSHTVPAATDRTHELVATGRDLLAAMRLERSRVRLIGFRLSGLGDADGVAQLSLLDDEGAAAEGEGHVPGERWGALDRAADAIVARYGVPAVSFASLLDDEEHPEEGAPSPDPTD
jgi:DNA polymerase IV